MLRALLAVLFLLIAAPAWGAIAFVSDLLGTDCVEQSADTSLTCTIDVDLDAGNVGVFIFSSDNVCTTAQPSISNTDEHTTATLDGNSMTKIREVCSGDGSAASGVTSSLWIYRATGTISAGASLVFNLSASQTPKAALGREFSVTSGNTLQSAGNEQDAAYDVADPGSVTISGLTSKEYLFIRVLGLEANAGTATTPTTSYTYMGTARSADVSGAVQARGEYRVLTGTGDTSDPTSPSGDWTTTYVALEEVSVATSRRPVAPIIFQ